MIRIASQQKCASASIPAWHSDFLAMLPAIRRYAGAAFYRLPPEAREEAVQEVTANALVAYVRLVELKKTDVAHPSVLAKYAIAQVCEGRRVGGRLRIREVLSQYAQRRKRFLVERLDHFDRDEGAWLEAVVEDRRTPVADQVAFRVDFPAWLAIRSRRDRRIAETLALGHSTTEVAKRFHVTASRISQKRRELEASWEEFHSGPARLVTAVA